VSGVSPVAGPKTAGQIEKETLKKRIANDEGRNSFYLNFLIGQSEATSTIRQSKIVIRHSAVLCLIQAIEAACLIIKIPCHLGVVS
jgi:hypothetical protein